MSVTLASQIMSDFYPLTDLYAKVPFIYAKISYFYTHICLLGLHCAGNICGLVLVCHIQSVANDSARTMRR